MIALLLVLLASSPGLDPAAEAYRAGGYERALELYRAALDDPGLSQGAVLYDMGNCSFRLGRYAEAVLHYRRARLRLPRDPELAFNLQLAEQKLGIAPPQSRSFSAALESLLDFFTPVELLLLASGLQAVALLGWVLLRRRRAGRGLMALLLLLGLAGAARSIHAQYFPGPPEGVVLAARISLRPEPHDGLEALLQLRAGEIVRVEEHSERWIRVVHPRGAGWTESAGIGVVD